MEGFLFLGFLFGMKHALEADHLAAVGAMAVQDGSMSSGGLTLRGAVWGLGHTTTLFAICAAVFLLGMTLTDRMAAALEFGVGVMLVVLGLDVVRRIRKQRIHFHVHSHDGEKQHLHAHSHHGDAVPHDANPHRHQHPSGFPFRAFGVGLIHGAAGSAALIALAVAETRDPWVAVGYALVFGLGSVAGMAALSAVVAWPLLRAERHARLIHTGISFGAAGLAVALGIAVMAETGPLAWTGV